MCNNPDCKFNEFSSESVKINGAWNHILCHIFLISFKKKMGNHQQEIIGTIHSKWFERQLFFGSQLLIALLIQFGGTSLMRFLHGSSCLKTLLIICSLQPLISYRTFANDVNNAVQIFKIHYILVGFIALKMGKDVSSKRILLPSFLQISQIAKCACPFQSHYVHQWQCFHYSIWCLNTFCLLLWNE